MKVMKFGGGCLRQAADFRSVASIIAEESETPLVVVSAMHGVTDRLLRLIDLASHSGREPFRSLKQLGQEHWELAAGLIPDHRIAGVVGAAIEKKLTELRRLFRGVACIRDVTPPLRAAMLSFGERLSALLLAGILSSQERRAAAMESDQIGIVAAGPADNAIILLNQTRRWLRLSLLPCIRRRVIPVVTGFFARNRSNRIVLLGRNGSDYSAAAIAAAIGADRLEIWKDVDGFMSADPRMVGSARRLDRLSYAEAAELSFYGASILHPRTVEPLTGHPIPIVIRNLHRPDDPGTLILESGVESDQIVKGVTGNSEVSRLRIHTPGMGCQPDLFAAIGRLLAERNIAVLAISTSPSGISLMVENRQARDSRRILLRQGNFGKGSIELQEEEALIAVVGEGFRQRDGLAARALAAVAARRINVEMISAGASAVGFTFITRREFMAEAVATLHREFFGV